MQCMNPEWMWEGKWDRTINFKWKNRREEEGGSTTIRCCTCYKLFELSLLQSRHSFLLTGNHDVFRDFYPCWKCGASELSTMNVGASSLTFWWHIIHALAVRPTFIHALLEELLRSYSTWHFRSEKLKCSTMPSCCEFYARSETLWNKPDIALVHSTNYYWPSRGCRSLDPPSGLPALGRISWPATTRRPISNLSHAHTGDILYLLWSANNSASLDARENTS